MAGFKTYLRKEGWAARKEWRTFLCEALKIWRKEEMLPYLPLRIPNEIEYRVMEGHIRTVAY